MPKRHRTGGHLRGMPRGVPFARRRALPIARVIAVALLATAPGLRVPTRAGEMEQRMSAACKPGRPDEDLDGA